MLNLSLIRHAKSDWENFDGDDMSRSISVKGIRKTEKISNFLREKEMTFDEIFCSPSRRTKETLKILIKNISNDPSIYYLDNLYHSSGIDIFDTLGSNTFLKYYFRKDILGKFLCLNFLKADNLKSYY